MVFDASYKTWLNVLYSYKNLYRPCTYFISCTYSLKLLHSNVVHFRYSKNLVLAKDYGIQKGIVAGVGLGFITFVMFGAYALAFWYGGKLIREDDYTAGRMLLVSTECTLSFTQKNQF